MPDGSAERMAGAAGAQLAEASGLLLLASEKTAVSEPLQ